MIKLQVTIQEMPNGQVAVHFHSEPGFATAGEEKVLKEIFPKADRIHAPRMPKGDPDPSKQ